MNNISSISIQNVGYAYGNRTVLEDINLEIGQGMVSIIGPNGSGKTTLLKLAGGLLNLQTGSIRLNGTPINDLTNLQRARLFTVVQQKQFFPFPFSCLEMVALGRYPHRRKLNDLEAEDYQIIVETMKSTSTLQMKDKLITEVSGGEQQRVILAGALAQQPKILFLDEAFSAMDISYQSAFIVLLKRMTQEKGLTVVSIVHDLNLAYRYSDAVCILKNGQIRGFGHPQTVMKEDVITEVFDVKVELIEGRCFYIGT